MQSSKWEIRKNKTSSTIIQFQKISKAKNLDELVNKDINDVDSLITKYLEIMCLINSSSTLIRKLNSIDWFYKFHNMEIDYERHLEQIPSTTETDVSQIVYYKENEA